MGVESTTVDLTTNDFDVLGICMDIHGYTVYETNRGISQLDGHRLRLPKIRCDFDAY